MQTLSYGLPTNYMRSCEEALAPCPQGVRLCHEARVAVMSQRPVLRTCGHTQETEGSWQGLGLAPGKHKALPTWRLSLVAQEGPLGRGPLGRAMWRAGWPELMAPPLLPRRASPESS